MLRIPQFRASLIILALAAATFGATQAQAHAKLVTTTPAAGTKVASPQTILLQFSEDIAKNLSSVKLTDTGGNAVTTMAMPAPDTKSLSLMPDQTLAPGRYTVSWTVVSTADSDKTTGSFQFAVQ